MLATLKIKLNTNKEMKLTYQASSLFHGFLMKNIDREYGDFIVHELIPYIEETYRIPFSKSPDMHFVSGGSSGGISAFVIAWFHSDYFHRVYMSSPYLLAAEMKFSI